MLKNKQELTYSVSLSLTSMWRAHPTPSNLFFLRETTMLTRRGTAARGLVIINHHLAYLITFPYTMVFSPQKISQLIRVDHIALWVHIWQHTPLCCSITWNFITYTLYKYTHQLNKWSHVYRSISLKSESLVLKLQHFKSNEICNRI